MQVYFTRKIEWKTVDVSPSFKKDDDLNNENYRPVSILSHI